MGRNRKSTRRKPHANPRGILAVRGSGYGFVTTAEGEYFIPESAMGGAFDGDLVEISRIAPRKGRGKGSASTGADKPTARIVRVIDRAHDTLIGRYEVAEPFGVVVPEDRNIHYDIFTMRVDNPNIPDGSLVRVRIVQFPTRKTAATGVVEEVLGDADDDSIAIDLIVARHKFETRFSDAAWEEAKAARLDEDEALSSGYHDLRDRFVFTIDPADAKDYDDALSIDAAAASDASSSPLCASLVGRSQLSRAAGESEASSRPNVSPKAIGREECSRIPSPLHNSPLGCCASLSHYANLGNKSINLKEGSAADNANKEASKSALWRVGVHIADVSYYVPWGSSIDMDARRRATSVYLVDRVIPMIPPPLSDDLCSLRPNEVRRTMTVDLYLDQQANVVRYEIYPALIRSNARLSYDEAQQFLDAAGDSGKPELASRLKTLSALAHKLAAKRAAAGAIDFSTVEAKAKLDPEGHPLAIDLRRKTDATDLIEQFMIQANETVASHLEQHDFPCVYRVHEKPSADTLAALIPVFQEFPWFNEALADRLPTGDPHAIQRIIKAVQGRPEEELITTLLLRSMKRAVYRPQNDGHYGLGSEAYCHFTSPIRRYPDLVVHRMLKAQLTKRPEKFGQEIAALPWLSEHSSDMERTADTAARESQEVKIIEYMEQFIGQSFTAIITSVATYGIYARLENTAEGFIPTKSLGREYFAFDPVRYTLTGQDTGRTYRLGQRVAITVSYADHTSGQLEFTLAKPKNS